VDEKKLDETLEFVTKYASHVTDWVIVKKELLKSLTPNERKLFSTRHPITKQQSMNVFEMHVAEKWEKLTGNKLIISKRS